MVEKQTVLRTDSVRVKLSSDMLRRVEQLAVDYCMPVATLCAFAVAEWVRGQDRQASLSRMAALDMSKRALAMFDMSDERMEKVFGSMFERVVKELALSPGALDREPADEAGK